MTGVTEGPGRVADNGGVLQRTDRVGSITLVVVIAIAMVAAALALEFLSEDQAEPLILGLLALLAIIGLFSLLAGAIGLIRFQTAEKPETDVARDIMDDAPEGAVVADKTGRVVYANPAYLALTGATGLGDVRPVERAFTGDPEVSEAIYRLSRAAQNGQRLVEEFRLAAPPNGSGAAWLRVRVRPVKGREGHTAWSVADISRERERQENAFQELQSAINYLDHAPAGFFSVNPAGEIKYVNATLAGLLDFDLAQFGPGGLRLGDILPGEATALLASTVGDPGAVKTTSLDVDLRRQNGTLVPVRLFHKVAFSADGHPGDSSTIVIDRGRGSESAEGQRAAEVRFARFFNNSPIAIATLDRRGRLLRMNAAFLLVARDTAKRDMTGQPLVDLVIEREREQAAELVHRAVSGMSGLEPIDIVFQRPDQRSARLWLAPVDSAEADGEAAIVYAVDTTEQRALQEQFAQSQKMQAVGQLAGGVAHDFNNVLGAIILAADFLIAGHKPADPAFQDILSIRNNANRAANLVRQLLAFSRRQTLRPQVLDLNDSVQDLSMLLRRLLGEKVALDVRHGRDLWSVKADVNQFEQVVVNLAVNARDAMPNGGRVTIRTSNCAAAEVEALARPDLPVADYVVVEVSDNGTGIPPAILDKIFEPFFTTKDVGKGTGLGLSTVYGIVKQTGGSILVDSTENVGTVFRIFLPRHIEVPAAARTEAEIAATEAAALAAPAPEKPKEIDLTGRGRILLVEDEEALRALSARTLKSRGFEVIEAGSGIEALAAIEEHGDVDLVVSDVVMPEMDGPTLLRELRKVRPQTRVIFVSGYAEEAFAKNMPEDESFAFLPKPFSMKQLVEAVKENLA